MPFILKSSIVLLQLQGRIVHPQDLISDAITDFRLQGLKPAGTAKKREERHNRNNQ
jgi:hypothetical protein